MQLYSSFPIYEPAYTTSSRKCPYHNVKIQTADMHRLKDTHKDGKNPQSIPKSEKLGAKGFQKSATKGEIKCYDCACLCLYQG